MDAAGRYSMPPDNIKKPEGHQPDEGDEHRVRDANEALKRFLELLNCSDADRDPDELERLRCKLLGNLGKSDPSPNRSQAPVRGIPLRPGRYRLVLPLPYLDDLPPADRDEIMLTQLKAADMRPKDGILHVMGPYIAYAQKRRLQKEWSAQQALDWLNDILRSISAVQELDIVAKEDLWSRFSVLRDVIALWVGSPPTAPAENKELDSATAEPPAAPPHAAIAAEGEQMTTWMAPPAPSEARPGLLEPPTIRTTPLAEPTPLPEALPADAVVSMREECKPEQPAELAVRDAQKRRGRPTLWKTTEIRRQWELAGRPEPRELAIRLHPEKFRDGATSEEVAGRRKLVAEYTWAINSAQNRTKRHY
jgi:hypothetical protein